MDPPNPAGNSQFTLVERRHLYRVAGHIRPFFNLFSHTGGDISSMEAIADVFETIKGHLRSSSTKKIRLLLRI